MTIFFCFFLPQGRRRGERGRLAASVKKLQTKQPNKTNSKTSGLGGVKPDVLRKRNKTQTQTRIAGHRVRVSPRMCFETAKQGSNPGNSIILAKLVPSDSQKFGNGDSELTCLRLEMCDSDTLKFEV